MAGFSVWGQVWVWVGGIKKGRNGGEGWRVRNYEPSCCEAR